jgi:hypothetical protein
LAIEKNKLQTSIALLKKQKEAIALEKKKEQERIAQKKQEQQLEIERLAQEQILEQERIARENQQQLEQENEYAKALRLALAQEEKELQKQKLLKASNALYQSKIEQEKIEKEKLSQLELMDALEQEHDDSNGLENDALALFIESERDEKKNKKKHKNKKDNFWTSNGFKDPKNWLSINLAYSSKVQNYHKQNSGREVLKASFSLSPYKGFFLGTTIMQDLNGYMSKAYQPDFVYSFGYRGKPVSLTYSNYSNNKFDGPGPQKRFHLDQGGLGLNYKTKVKDLPLSISLSHSLSNSTKKLSVNTHGKIFDKIMVSGQLKHYFEYPQNQLTLTAKTFLYEKFFISGSTYFYSHADNQVPFEPDYAYSFGWKDSRPFHPSIVYSSYYTPTRWPNREREGADFEDGGLSISMKIKF